MMMNKIIKMAQNKVFLIKIQKMKINKTKVILKVNFNIMTKY